MGVHFEQLRRFSLRPYLEIRYSDAHFRSIMCHSLLILYPVFPRRQPPTSVLYAGPMQSSLSADLRPSDGTIAEPGQPCRASSLPIEDSRPYISLPAGFPVATGTVGLLGSSLEGMAPTTVSPSLSLGRCTPFPINKAGSPRSELGFNLNSSCRILMTFEGYP